MAQIIPTSQKGTKDKKRIEFLATGKRKNSIARVRLSSGDGTMVVNERPLSTYFGRATLQMLVRQPFEETGTAGKFNVNVNVCGGGLSGQAGAVRHGISRALLKMNLDLRKQNVEKLVVVKLVVDHSIQNDNLSSLTLTNSIFILLFQPCQRRQNLFLLQVVLFQVLEKVSLQLLLVPFSKVAD